MQQTNTHCGSQEEEFLEDMYLYQLREGKSQNPTVAIHINGIPISLHLDTQADVTVVTEKHYGKLRVNCHLQQTSVATRSYSGEGKGPVLPVIGKFTVTLARGEKEIAEPVYVVKKMLISKKTMVSMQGFVLSHFVIIDALCNTCRTL